MGGYLIWLFSHLSSVKQERIKAKKAKKPKTPSSAGKEFLGTLFAP
jgi:hypothetical protein